MKQLRRLLPYYTPYRGELIAGLLLVVFSTAITAVIPLKRCWASAVSTCPGDKSRARLSLAHSVIASDRVSTIRDASWIMVLDEGRIAEQGRHDDLMMTEGRYWALPRRQQLVEAIEGTDETTAALIAVTHG